MWYPFILQNIHFATYLIGAVVCISTGWLYADAWVQSKKAKEFWKVAGYIVLAISFIVSATIIEFGADSGLSTHVYFSRSLRMMSYLFLSFGLIIDPLQPRPKYNAAIPLGVFGLTLPLPILSGSIAFLYMRRATVGLEHHVKPPAASFFVLALHDLVTEAMLFHAKTQNVDIFRLTAPFGPLWILRHIIFALFVVILARWVFGYLIKRFNSQFFLIFTNVTLVAFVLITVSFTFLLMRNLQSDTISKLTTSARVLSYSIDTRLEQQLSDAQALAASPALVASLSQNDTATLFSLAQSYLVSKSLSSVVILDADGKVIARGEDRERIGMSLSDDAIAKKARAGSGASGLAAQEGAFTGKLILVSAAPIGNVTNPAGVVLVGVELGNAFLDGIKDATGLDSSLYIQDTLSATTLEEANAQRPIGIKEKNERILTAVLKRKVPSSGEATFLNRGFLVSYLPLVDSADQSIGMLSVAVGQESLLQTAAVSIEATFRVTALLLFLSFLPALWIAKRVSSQLE